MKFHIPFKNDDDRITLARQVIVDTVLNSLENDVNECLRYSYNRKTAPTNAYSPALLYCFSAIDLMGSLYAGRAKGSDTSRKAENYMIDFMKYSGDNVKKLQMIYRHKLVHLAIPKTVFYYNGRYITWKLHDPDQAHHLTTETKSGRIPIGILTSVTYDEIFIVNITKLKDDIKASVEAPLDGYIARLRNESSLLQKFDMAIHEIYDPSVTR